MLYAECAYATVGLSRLSVRLCLSVCDVQESLCFSHRLEYVENNVMPD